MLLENPTSHKAKEKDVLGDSTGRRPVSDSSLLKRTRSARLAGRLSLRSPRILIPWALSAFLALTLFTTFTYQPPNLPDQHPHILHNDLGATISHKDDNTSRNNNNNHQQTTAVDEIDLASLHLPADAKSVLLNEVPANHPMNQNPIMGVLREAAVSEIALEDWKKLPGLTKSLSDLYGNRIVSSQGPIVLGMETCQAYRDAVPMESRYLGPAGMFNTGTNALEHHLRKNVLNVGYVWQVPWGKHRMPYQRLKHVAPGMEKKNQAECLPVVIVRDPYNWMQSMCKSPYAAHWKHGRNRCPNLAVNEKDKQAFHGYGNGVANATSFRVKVIFDKDDVEFFDSLADLWSEWYDYFFKATYPRLIIRFEDMLLQAPAIMAKIAECVGTEPRNPIEYQTGSAKAHGSHTDFLKAILKSADSDKRRKSLEPRDLEYAKVKLKPELMEAFEYKLLES